MLSNQRDGLVALKRYPLAMFEKDAAAFR
ncbi:hypothetical protein SPHINGO391_420007 [Sphingomonas aurantiaca]|uniref:Uncharacterized protein n=1 Tax=Sphingomonas aurantiaca TaxID=185949 RepID=A0A5E7Z0W3_9SPHN|nr:hypothetical protein SPHINGO391_420007 [Sphingomonas aurantiaca]